MHGQHGPRPLRPDPDPHRRPGRRVDAGVGQQVRQHLPQPVLVAADQQRLRRHVQAPPVRHVRCLGVGDRVSGQQSHVDLFAFQRPALVEPGQQQEVFDQLTHPVGFALDPAHRPRQVVRVGRGRAAEQLGVAADAGQRRPQLVAGVRDEAPQPLLGGRPGRERAVHVAEHHVQGLADLSDLGARRLDRHPVGQAIAWPRSRGRAATRRAVTVIRSSGRRPRRTSQAPSTPTTTEGCGEHDDLDQQQPADRLVDRLQRQAGDEYLAGGKRVRRHPVAAQPAGQVHGLGRAQGLLRRRDQLRLVRLAERRGWRRLARRHGQHGRLDRAGRPDQDAQRPERLAAKIADSRARAEVDPVAGLRQLLVDLAEQERLQGTGGGEPDPGQHDGHQHDEPDRQAPTDRQPLQAAANRGSHGTHRPFDALFRTGY